MAPWAAPSSAWCRAIQLESISGTKMAVGSAGARLWLTYSQVALDPLCAPA